VLVVLLYLRLPHDEGYLVPAIPFALLIAATVMPRTLFRWALVCLVISPFLAGVDVDPPKKGLAPATRSAACLRVPAAGQMVILDLLRGPIVQDHDKRVRAVEVLDAAVSRMKSEPPSYFVLAGTLSHYLEYALPLDWAGRVYADVAPATEVERRLAAGERVYYLPDVPARVRRILGYDLLGTGARPLFAEAEKARP